MRTAKTIIHLALMLACAAPAARAVDAPVDVTDAVDPVEAGDATTPVDAPDAVDPVEAEDAIDPVDPVEDAAEAEDPLDLTLLFEAAVGFDFCLNAGESYCDNWPKFNGVQETGGHLRLGASVFLPDPVAFLAAGLILDMGGNSVAASDESSVIFTLAAMLRGIFPLEAEGFELITGLGIGLAHWSADDWTGLTIPLNVGLGYEALEGLIIGADVTYEPRLIGDQPHNFQFGIYATYVLSLSEQSEPAKKR